MIVGVTEDAAIAAWAAIGTALLAGMFSVIVALLNKRTLGRKNGSGTVTQMLEDTLVHLGEAKSDSKQLKTETAKQGALTEAHMLLDRQRIEWMAEQLGVSPPPFLTEEEMIAGHKTVQE